MRSRVVAQCVCAPVDTDLIAGLRQNDDFLVVAEILICLGRGGRYLVIGFASGIEAEEVPMVSGRVLCFGNFDILGVILSYVDAAVAPFATPYAPVPVPRFNPPVSEVGQRVHARLLALLDRRAIRPIVGQRVPFEGLARALDEMESRSTMGRIVVER